MDRKKSLAKYLHDYLIHEAESDSILTFNEMILNGIDAFENGAFDGEEYEIIVDKVTRRI